MSAQPYLAARPREGRQCLLCNEVFTPKERPQTIKPSGLITVKGKAELWAAINVPEEDTPYHEFTFVKERLGNISTECEGHEMCRMKFRTHVERKQKEYGGQEDAGDPMDEDMMQPELPTKTDVHQGKRLMRKVQQKAICFICNTQTPKDCNPYSDGGLGRCSDKRAVTKLEEKIKLTSPGDKYEDAVERFKLLLCGQAFDVFAVDVYYHKTCYTNFTRPTKSANKDVAKDEETQDELITRLKVIGNKVKTEFLALIERKVIKEKEAYLATDLLDEFGSLCTENGLEKGQSSITYTYELKRELQKRFGNAISFYLTGRKLIVHPTSVNPCLYATATLKGAGLRDDDVTRAFANMLRRRLVTETKQAWPITAEELIAKLNKCGPVDVLYNAIAWSINPNATKNESGYVVTSSKSLARKVWSVSSDWEALLTHERSTKSTALSLTVHRLTGSKEATTMLHKCGHGVSYSDVRLLNNTWAQQVTSQNSRKVPGGFVKGKPVHVTIDNSDGRQQTLTGAHTTHYTNGTIFQNHMMSDIPEDAPNHEQQEEHPPLSLQTSESTERDYGSYKVKKKKEPPATPAYEDCRNRDLLDWCMRRDIVWVIVSALGDQVLGNDNESSIPPVGSWTTFMKAVTPSETRKSLLNYMEVVPLPPSDTICKWYMDLLTDMADDFGVQCIFAHSDEAIYCKMVLIQWLHQGKYDKIINLLGGFHTIMVKLKIMYKKYGALGLRDWWVDAGAIAEGSSAQAIEGRHYFRAIRLHKQSFEALLRLQIRNIGDVSMYSEEFRFSLGKLRCAPSASQLETFMSNPEFQQLANELIISSGGTQSAMMTAYLKDVSEMLALISSVRENSIERHIQAERALLPQLFAFGHMNYARYLTYQHVTLTNLHESNPEAWNELKERGFGGSLRGGAFSTVHGDYITEVTVNREVKVRGGPLHGGYSTSLKAEDAFIKTSHLMAKVRAALKEKLSILTTSVHKEVTDGARREHEKTVESMVEQMSRYMDPFASGVARHIKTGEAIPEDVVKGLLHSTQLGETLLAKFIDERLKMEGDDRVSFFKAITNQKIKTGLEKPKKFQKVVNILKEEKQAFGVLVGKATTAREAHSHPLTSVPLALSTEESCLRQGAKSVLRNHIIEETKAEQDEPPTRAEWLIDGMAAVQAVPPKSTWKEYAESLLKFCMPPAEYNPVRVAIIMDTYGERRIKNQKRRSQSGRQGRRIFITEPGQSMPQGADWSTFLSSGENKTNLICFLSEYYRSQAVRFV